MKSTRIVSLAVAALLSVTAFTPAAHAAQCNYHVVNTFGGSAPNITGWGAAFKKKNACKRAKDACLRKLRKHWKKHGSNNLQGSGLKCVRV